MFAELIAEVLVSVIDVPVPQRWRRPRATRHADGSVTVPGLIRGFTSPYTRHGWISGYVTISTTTLIHSADPATRLARREITLTGSEIFLASPTPRQRSIVGDAVVARIITATGCEIGVAIDRAHRELLADLPRADSSAPR